MKRWTELGPRARAAVAEAAEYYGIPAQDIVSKRRLRACVMARKRVFETLRSQNWTLAQIGQAFGYHHTSVLYMLRRRGFEHV